jgi:hypothetical protein
MLKVSGRGLEVLDVFFRDQHKGDDECVKDFGVVVVAAPCLMAWGS